MCGASGKCVRECRSCIHVHTCRYKWNEWEYIPYSGLFSWGAYFVNSVKIAPVKSLHYNYVGVVFY